MALPATPLAGEHDARAVAQSPGGLALVRGRELALALNLEDPDAATRAGQGFGAFVALAGGGGLLPRLGVGLGLEWLRPSRAQLTPDPGAPFRATVGVAAALGRSAGLGVAWHRFSAAGALGGRTAYDVGLSARLGARLAVGAVLRDLTGGTVGDAPVERRYELEVALRPAATDRLELAAGGRLAEDTEALDGWGRLSARVARGVFAHAAVETRALRVLASSPGGPREEDEREARATLGVEIALGSAGVAMYATGLRSARGERKLLGGQAVLRWSAVPPASALPRARHIERVDLAGAIGPRQLTAHVARLRAIARDPTAVAVVVSFDDATAGWATLQELRAELLALRRAGKRVVAYLGSASGREYFVASAADRVYMDPVGALRLVGIAGTTIYWRGLLDRVGVLPQFQRIAEYKSAPETYLETAPSEPAERMTRELYDSLWEQWLAQVGASRKLERAALQRLVDEGPYTAGELAGRRELIDAVAPPERVVELITRELGGGYGVASAPAERPDRWQRPGVAVIYVDGDLVDGASRTLPIVGQRLAGGQTLARAIAAARASPRVGAIVLRIDSPGGSAVASELVAREVFATRGVKPIVCSLGDVAASGGYFVAAGCDVIFAAPMTVTGSIGAYYGKLNVAGLLARLGVTTHTHRRGVRADAESYFRPYTPEEHAALLDKLRYTYGRFVAAVAEGRGLTRQAVDAVGRGHVWTGAQAQPIRLVDRHGGIGDALEEARRRMGLAPGARIDLYELPRSAPGLAGLVGRLAARAGLGAAPGPGAALADLPAVRALLRGIAPSLLVDPTAPQARLPFDLIEPE